MARRLTSVQRSVLRTLDEAGGQAGAAAVGERSGQSPPFAASVLASLVLPGLVAEIPGRGSPSYRLTDAGRAEARREWAWPQ